MSFLFIQVHFLNPWRVGAIFGEKTVFQIYQQSKTRRHRRSEPDKEWWVHQPWSVFSPNISQTPSLCYKPLTYHQHFKLCICWLFSRVSFNHLELLASSRDEPLLQLAQERSCWNDHRGDMSEAYHGGKLRCYVHIMDQGLCYRVNTLAAYIEANRLVSQRKASLPNVLVWK